MNNFKITFSCRIEEKVSTTANVERKPLGLSGVEKIREKAGVNLPLERIDEWIHHFNSWDVHVEISEEMAQDSGHFNEINDLIISIPINFLNKFLKEKVFFQKDSRTGEIEKAWIEPKLSTKKMILWWVDNDFITFVEP